MRETAKRYMVCCSFSADGQFGFLLLHHNPETKNGERLGVSPSWALQSLVGTFVLNYVAVKAFQSAAFGRNRELTVLLSVIIGLGATWAAHAAKLSAALGAFVAGMFLGNSKFAVQIRADVASLRIVLLTLFFAAVGMIADPVWMFRNLPMVLSVAALIIAAKSIILVVVLLLFGKSRGVALSTGLCLCQVGEFAFVLGSEARTGNILTESQHSLVVSAAIVTLMVTPWLISIAPLASAWLNRRRGVPKNADSEHSPNHPACEFLIVGFGPAGRGTARYLEHVRDRVLVLDLSPAGIAAAESMGFRTEIGDASNAEVLEHLHLEHLRMVVVTLPSRDDSLAILNQIRMIAPQATMIVRSRHQIHMSEFMNSGADIVVGDEEEVQLALASIVRQQCMKIEISGPVV